MWTVRWHWVLSCCCPTITTIHLQTFFIFPNWNAVPMKQSFFMCFTASVSSWFFFTAPVPNFLFLMSPLIFWGYVFLSLNSCVLSINSASRLVVSPIFRLGGLLSLEALGFPWEPQYPWMADGLGRGGVRPPLGLFLVSCGEQVGSGVPLTVETWVLNLGLLAPWCQVPPACPPGQLDPLKKFFNIPFYLIR